MKEKIIIFDTTLRDGEQSPGASLNIYEKIEIAHQLAKLNVDVIEAGFPVSSPAQFDAVHAISSEVDKIIAGLCRANEKDIDSAFKALQPAKHKRIHTFTSTSDFHILGKFGHEKYGVSLEDKRKTILKMTSDSVAYAKSLCEDVEYSAEDAGRTDIGYLAEVIEAAIEAGANVVNIPDTTGYTFPTEFGNKIKELKRRVKNIDKAVISVHCHNDLGLAVANSIASIENGARQIECTVNGIGERAGNASLEEIVMALKVRGDIVNFDTDINTREIYNTSRLVSGFTGILVQRNKAIVGENAFAHESGIHQDGMLKNRDTYEIMTPELVGYPNTKIILGRHSGRHGLKARLNQLGYEVSEEKLIKLYEKFTKLADKKKEVFDNDLRILMGDTITEKDEFYSLDHLQITSGSKTIPTAVVKIKIEDQIIQESAIGDGPIDAVFNAIERALSIHPEVESYNVRSVTSGRQALGEVLLRIRSNSISFTGRGVSTDVIEASALAYLSALNKKNAHFKLNEKFNKENELTKVG
ncbi:MAG: 2-isopropylmalate synthase [Ignavibacteriales bacterium]|nr:2-isopropylmalate synthase [Ignavibacteriales bacterium]